MPSSATKIEFSLEVFPAASEAGQAELIKTVTTLARLAPRFVSVTHGANGGDQNLTLNTLDSLRIANPTLGLAGHLTSRAGSKGETLAAAEDYEAAGAQWIVAVRGDSSDGAGKPFQPHPHGFRSTPELVMGLRERTSMRIAVSGYPEAHPESRGESSDLEHLKRKVDAGADAIITQFFFDNDDFYRYVDKCRGAGIEVPIVPGIMPIHNFQRIAQFSAKCGTRIPARIAERFEKAEERGASRDLALAICAGQCDDLREQGVSAFHFYTLNRSDLTLAVCQALGLDPQNPVEGTPRDAETEEIAMAVSA